MLIQLDMDEIIQRWKPYVDEQYLDTLYNFFTNAYTQKDNEKMIIIKGEPCTGKSTFVSAVVDYIGNGRISHINDFKNKDLIIVSEPNHLLFEPFIIAKIHKLLDMKRSLILICNDIIIPDELEDRVEIINFKHSFFDSLQFVQK